MGKLDGRVAFVTGAGRGIGAATALRLAEDGASVVLADIDPDGCKEVAAQIESAGSYEFLMTAIIPKIRFFVNTRGK